MNNMKQPHKDLLLAKAQNFWASDIEYFNDLTQANGLIGWMIKDHPDLQWFIFVNQTKKTLVAIDTRNMGNDFRIPQTDVELYNLLSDDRIAENQVAQFPPVQNINNESISWLLVPRQEKYFGYMIAEINQELLVLFITDKNRGKLHLN